jgi:hypothetical protein
VASKAQRGLELLVKYTGGMSVMLRISEIFISPLMPDIFGLHIPAFIPH